jgi:hypothetical protein
MKNMHGRTGSRSQPSLLHVLNPAYTNQERVSSEKIPTGIPKIPRKPRKF